MSFLLETERLFIRELLPEDAPEMFQMDGDPEVHRYVGRKPVSSVEQIYGVIANIRQQYIDHGIGRWAVIEKSTGNFIGWTGFKRMTEMINGVDRPLDFGYRLVRNKWGQGLATEAGRASLDYGIRELGFKDIYAMTDIDNTASRRILEKLGFHLEGIFDYDATPTWRTEKEPTTWYHYAQ